MRQAIIYILHNTSESFFQPLSTQDQSAPPLSSLHVSSPLPFHPPTSPSQKVHDLAACFY
jgi:hypothetical protein